MCYSIFSAVPTNACGGSVCYPGLIRLHTLQLIDQDLARYAVYAYGNLSARLVIWNNADQPEINMTEQIQI